MKLLFVRSAKPREAELAAAFCTGAAKRGVEVRIALRGKEPSYDKFDAIAMVGVKSHKIFQQARAARAIPIMLDKGYMRHRRPGGRTWEYWRVSFGAHQPTRTTLMSEKMPADRFEALNLQPAPWKQRGSEILLAGSSAKYHEFYGLPDPTAYARAIVGVLHHHTHLPLVYRPKPSWREAVKIDGAEYSPGHDPLGPHLRRAWAVVTHGSNICFEAAMAGVPMVVLGDAIGAPIAVRTMDRIMDPIRPRRERWFANLAYHQWTEQEMRDGEMWKIAERWLKRLT